MKSVPIKPPVNESALDMARKVVSMVEDGTLVDFAYVAKYRTGEWLHECSGTDNALEMSSMLICEGLRRIGFKVEK